MVRRETVLAKRIQKRKEKRANSVIINKDERSFTELPFEIISEVFLKLVIEDLVRSKSVCKTWYNVIRDPHFIHLHMEKALTQPKRILAYENCLKYILNSLFLIDTKSKCTKIPLKKLDLTRDHKIVASCNGLLCIASRFMGEPVYIHNPITGAYTKLPEQEHRDFKTRGVLYDVGFDQLSKKYKVICVYRPYYWDTDYIEGNVSEDPLTTGEIITEGEDSWRKLEFPCQVDFGYGSKTVFLDEAFHWKIDIDDRFSEAFYWMMDSDDRTSDSNSPSSISDDHTSGSNLILAFHIGSEKFHTLSFPHVDDELPDSLSLINFDESLAFVETDTLDSSAKIWKVVGSGINERLLCRYTLNFKPENNGLTYFRRVVGMLSNGTFVYKVTERLEGTRFQQLEMQQLKSDILPMIHLSIDNPDEKQCFKFKMQGRAKASTAENFDIVLYVPTFTSPIKPIKRGGRGREHNGCMSCNVSPSETLSISPSFTEEWLWRKGTSCEEEKREEGEEEERELRLMNLKIKDMDQRQIAFMIKDTHYSAPHLE